MSVHRALLRTLKLTLRAACLFVGYQSRLSADASSSSKSAETVLAALLNAAPTATTLLTLHSPALVEGLARDFAVPATDIRVHGFLDSLTSRERGGPFERSATEDEDRIELQPLAAEKPAACVVEWFKKGGMRTSGQKGLSGIKREGDCLAVVPVYAVISQEKSYAPVSLPLCRLRISELTTTSLPESEDTRGRAQGRGGAGRCATVFQPVVDRLSARSKGQSRAPFHSKGRPFTQHRLRAR